MVVDELYYGSPCPCCGGVSNYKPAEATFTVDEDVIMEFVRNVYENEIGSEDFDTGLWNEYVRIFKEAVYNGYKQSSNTEFDRKGRLAQQIENNIEVFSAFKVHNEQELMASKMLDSEGKMVGFEEFKKNTESIIKHHNESWLQTEFSTASLRASQAADWQEFVANSDIFPNLKWMPTTSAHPDEVVHGKYSGLTHEMPQVILPVNDKFWNNHRPGDRWNCKCSLEPTDEPSLHETNKRAASVAEGGAPTGQKGLQANPGINGEIFDKSHPYHNSVSKDKAEVIKSKVKYLHEMAELHNDENYKRNINDLKRSLNIDKVSEMSHNDADRGNTNPLINTLKKNNGYKNNCQSCVVAYELRRRGFDVIAAERIKEDDFNIPEIVAHNTMLPWKTKFNLIPHRKVIKQYGNIDTSYIERCESYMSKNVGRYHIQVTWNKKYISDNGKEVGHIFCAEVFPNGKILYSDPQSGNNDYLTNDVIALINAKRGIYITRVDNLLIDPFYAKGLTQNRNQNGN